MSPVIVDARSRRLVSAGLSGVGGRLAAVLLGLVLTPVIVGGLGDERYGVFATLTLAVSLLSFSDLGVGNGLITRTAAAGARGDVAEQRRLASVGFAIMATAGTVVAAATLVLVELLPWRAAFGAPGVPEAELRQAVLAFGLLFAAGVPGAVGQKLLLGLQRGATVNAWVLAGTCASLLGAAAASAAGARLPLVVAATVGPPILLSCCSSLWLFCVARRDLAPRRVDVTLAGAVSLLRVGGLFLVLNAAVALAFQTDLLVVSAVLGASAAAVLAICLRVFSLVQQSTTAVLTQLWPAFADALASGDARWVRRAWWRSSLGIAGVAAPVLLLLALTGDRLIEWWVGPSLVPPTSLLLALALWTLQQACIYPTAMLLNGAEIVRFQVVAASSMAVTNIGLSIVLAQAWGVAGPVWASLITHTALNAVPAVVVVWRRVLSTDARPGLVPATSPA